jgi:hypothetical protein
MNITQITVSYGETQSLPEYSNVKPNITITAALDEGDNPEVIEEVLWEQAKAAVHEQIDLALEANAKAAKYSTEPRFQVLRTYQGYTARGRIEQPKIVAILPDGMRLEKRLDERMGGASYRETKKLRHSHALRMATEIAAEDPACVLLDCADGDISRLEALLPPLPEPPPAQHPIDAQPDIQEEWVNDDPDEEHDDE